MCWEILFAKDQCLRITIPANPFYLTRLKYKKHQRIPTVDKLIQSGISEKIKKKSNHKPK